MNKNRLSTKLSVAGAEQAECIGCALQVMSQCKFHASFPVSRAVGLLTSAYRHGMLRVYFGAAGNPVAYAAWAFISTESEEKLAKGEIFNFHFSEWNEGEQLWIIDFAAPLGHAYAVCRDLQRSTFGRAEYARYARVQKGYLTVRQTRLRNALQIHRDAL
jgi:hemolysin-activating ACP:hemolysin acyltransferase